MGIEFPDATTKTIFYTKMRHRSFSEIMPFDSLEMDFAFIPLLKFGITDFQIYFPSSGQPISGKQTYEHYDMTK